MVNSLDLLAPYKQSAAWDDTEVQLQQIFIRLFEAVFSDQINDIHHYGMPHMGGAKVVERFTKQDGLVVLRRPNASDVLMRVIYANWKSLASKRGLAFLEFVLEMLWPGQWKIHRMYHSVSRADYYPMGASKTQTANSFLTSRINVEMDTDIDVDELRELTPTLQRLVPAHIVPTIAINIDLGDDIEIGAAVAMFPQMIATFQYE